MHLSRRSDRKRFVVSIYLAEDAVEFPHNDRLSIPLTRLYGGAVSAEDAKRAAAKAWIKHVGRHRHERLIDLESRTLAVSEIAPSIIIPRLTESILCPVDNGFILDNGIEAWLISVREVGSMQ